MINERSRLYNLAAKGWNSSKFINFLPAAVQDIPGISHEAANLIINATSIREYGVACLSSSSQRRRAPHKLLPSRDTQARKLYSFLVSISSLIPGHRMQISPQPRLDGRILAAIFFPSSPLPLPLLPRFSIPGKIDEKAFYTGDERFPRAPLTSKRGIF